jgi:NTP pyrophosphatase (non-canonical NTP hydrolase)
MFTRLMRPFVANWHIDGALKDAQKEIKSSIDKHGQGAFVTPHEINGVLMEEVKEFQDALHDNDLIQVYEELAQVAQVAIFGMASIRQAAQLSIENEGVRPREFFEKKMDKKSISYPDDDVNLTGEGDSR